MARGIKNSPEAFWQKVDRRELDECWPWQGSTNNKGYGWLSLEGKRWYAHRLAYKLAKGDPTGRLVCHRCDYPSCCNPNHLFLGTAKENARDMIKKRRGWWDNGYRSSKASLSPDQVRLIRQLRAQGYSYRDIGRIAKVNVGSVQGIVLGICYRDIE